MSGAQIEFAILIDERKEQCSATIRSLIIYQWQGLICTKPVKDEYEEDLGNVQSGSDDLLKGVVAKSDCQEW